MTQKISKIFAAAALCLMGLQESKAQINIPLPEESVAVLDTAGIGKLRTEFSRTQLGQDLLDLADRHETAIGFDSLMNRAGGFDRDGNRLALHPALSQEEQIVILAHEIWHLRQAVTLHAKAWEEAPLLPSQLFTLLQCQEAEAFAFSSYFWADRMKELGQNPAHINPGRAAAEFFFAKTLHHEMQGDGLSAAEYRFGALEPSFMRLSDMSYVDTHLQQAWRRTAMIKTLADTAEHYLSIGDTAEARRFVRLGTHFLSQKPDDADVVEMLRHYGGFRLEGGAETALGNRAVVTPARLKDYATESSSDLMTEVTRNALDTFDSLYGEAGDRIYRAAATLKKPASP